VGVEPSAPEDAGEGRDVPQAAPGSAARRTRWLPWALLLLLALALVGAGVQTRRVGQLEDEVEGLQRALSDARAELRAYRVHLGAVRDGVARLRNELLGLEALVEQEPGASEPEASAP
jgi:hypothetical protein